MTSNIKFCTDTQFPPRQTLASTSLPKCPDPHGPTLTDQGDQIQYKAENNTVHRVDIPLVIIYSVSQRSKNYDDYRFFYN